MMQHCNNPQSTVMTDPINRALGRFSQKPALTRSLLRHIRQANSVCKSCRQDVYPKLLSCYRGGNDPECPECSRFLDSLYRIIPPASDLLERRIQSNLIGGLYRFGPGHVFIPAAPVLVTWELTARCNMSGCRHCHINAGNSEKIMAELTTGEAEGIIDQMAQWGVAGIAFTGGEALLRPDFLALLDYATRRGLFCYMATNGLLLNDRNIRELKVAGLCLVHISVDGCSPETHDRFRGHPGAFDQAIKAAGKCMEQGLQVALAATPTSMNASEMPRLLQMADNLGVDWFITYNYLPAGRGGVDLDLDGYRKNRLFHELKQQSERCRKTRWLSFAPQMAVYDRAGNNVGRLSATHYYEPLFTQNIQSMVASSTACMAGKYYLAIKADGNVVPCIFLPESIGNVRHDQLQELWGKSETLRNLRNPDAVEGFCRDCLHSRACGGCRARARAYTGNYLASDPHCPIASRLLHPIGEENLRISGNNQALERHAD